MGAYLGKSSGFPFTKQADRKLVCFSAKASFFTDRSVGISSRSSELDLLREPLSVAAHTAGEHVRELESSGAVSCTKTKPVYVENAPSQAAIAGESTSTPTDMRQLPRKGGKHEWQHEKEEGSGLALIPSVVAPSWCNVPPGSRTGLLAKLDQNPHSNCDDGTS